MKRYIEVEKDRMIAGLCGRVGDYFQIDPNCAHYFYRSGICRAGWRGGLFHLVDRHS